MLSFLTYGPESLYKVLSGNQTNNVGVRDFFLESTKAPVRLYYPALKPTNPEPVRIFRDPTKFVDGYLWSFSKNRPWLYATVSTFVSLLRFVIPLRYLQIPEVSRDAKPEGQNLPLVVYSHGLTGTGEENTMLLASVAAHGFVVASVHHTDASSCYVRTGDGREIWYEHPDPQNYSIRFREDQLDHRVQEMMDVTKVLLSHSDFRGHIDDSQVVSCGFSYGGATAALATVRHPEQFSACVVIDGWFHLDLYGVKTYFPLDIMKERKLPVPTFFLNCSQFMKWKTGTKAKELAATSPTHRHKVYGSKTNHMLFVDLASWVPHLLSSQVKSYITYAQGEESAELTEEYITDIIKWLLLQTKANQAQL